MQFNINDFSGPLDLLFHMCKKREMDIYEIDLTQIIDEYIDFINQVQNYDLDTKSEYLIMASELIHLKSKILLGFDEEENESEYTINSEEDLRNRIIEFAKYQDVSESFRKLESNRQDYFTKTPENLDEYGEKTAILNDDVDFNDLIKAFLQLQERLNYKKPVTTKVTRKELSLEDKTKHIRNLLNLKKKVEFTELFEDVSKEELVITFLAILEMSKSKEVLLSQDKNFSKIYIEVKHE